MNVKNIILIGVLMVSSLLSAVETVAKVDINKYMGKWYQFAWFPNKFQPKDAALSVAEYTLDGKGKIIVTNTSYSDFEGKKPMRSVTGKAYSTNEGNSKLKVSFFWPFYGDYWIVKLDANYRYAVVSDSKQKYLWVLSREPYMDKATYQEIVSFLQKGGWDTKKIQVTGRFK